MSRKEAERRIKELGADVKAAERFEENICWVVENRAWDILGYDNFKEMWKGQLGFDVPAIAVKMAVYAFEPEVTTTRGYPNGLVAAEVSQMIGYSDSSTGTVSGLIKQARTNVPVEKAVVTTNNSNKKKGGRNYADAILEYGSGPEFEKWEEKRKLRKAKPKQTRAGKGDNEYVNENLYIEKWKTKAVQALVDHFGWGNKVDGYRQAVDEMLRKYKYKHVWQEAVTEGTWEQ